MTPDDYLEVLHQALSSPHGVTLEFGDWQKAERARGRLYRLRNALRRSGNRRFDVLMEIMAEGNTSVRVVTEALNARGVPSREGGLWHLRSTHALLKRLVRHTAATGAAQQIDGGSTTGH